MSGLHNNEAEQVWLAPMSGSTDAAFRRQAVRFGAPAVVSEMVAGEALAAARPDVVRRTCRHEGRGRWIVQLAARRPEDMETGAMLLAEAGVDQIDINMGCPSRQVTGGSSGSALMKEPELARAIIDAALRGGAGLPVSLKMRLGWNDDMLNAPDIAQYAERAGICMLTVHGRTRCQFYKGQADWARIHDTVAAVNIPVIANGDIDNVETARMALEQSGAHGVMIGRAAMGEPWLPGKVAAELAGDAYVMPAREVQLHSLLSQIDDSQTLYGDRLGLRIVRKHIAAAIDKLPLDWSSQERRTIRAAACQMNQASELKDFLSGIYLQERRVAA
ncbi:tRNA dihydrouridine synthase [Henriciella aquimarina]|uniref:tRNA dihydrouridine synthase n=1 Tax=Henriciella aquimarina TaxID=545261 RepID=UPI000A009908|nr:tRNA-dihydrouridine synthase family protein [Henriciella aquimarina]